MKRINKKAQDGGPNTLLTIAWFLVTLFVLFMLWAALSGHGTTLLKPVMGLFKLG